MGNKVVLAPDPSEDPFLLAFLKIIINSSSNEFFGTGFLH